MSERKTKGEKAPEKNVENEVMDKIKVKENKPKKGPACLS